MNWQRGLKRLRLVATVALALGVVIVLSIWITGALGYGPNPGFETAYDMLAHLGVISLVLGAFLWVAVWILQGFIHEAPAEPPAPARAHLDS